MRQTVHCPAKMRPKLWKSHIVCCWWSQFFLFIFFKSYFESKNQYFSSSFFSTRGIKFMSIYLWLITGRHLPPKNLTQHGAAAHPPFFSLLNERGLFGGDPYRNKFSRHDLLYYDMMKIRVTFQLSINRLLSFSLLSWLTARKMFRNQCKICVTLYFEKETKLVFTKSTYEKKNLLECCFI